MDLLDTFGNFVIASDRLAGKVTIFLIDEKDPENDDDKDPIFWETHLPGLEAIKYV